MNPTAGLSSSMFDVAGASGLDQNASKQRMEQVGVEFESVFLSLMLKEMRNTLEGGGFFGEEGSDTYGGMFDLFIGKHLADAKPLGVGELLLQQYRHGPSTPEPAKPSGEEPAGEDPADADPSGTLPAPTSISITT